MSERASAMRRRPSQHGGGTKPWSKSHVRLVLASMCLLVGTTMGCAHRQERELQAASRELGRAVARNDARAVWETILPGLRSRTDVNAMMSKSAKAEWVEGLGHPARAQPQALVLLGAGDPVIVELTAEGWRFAEDPTRYYGQATPRQALETLVRASKLERWDILLELAPKRYRLGLSQTELARAWNEGEQGAALRAARNRLAMHLSDPIVADAHEAVLDMGQGHVARLEREGDRWVVVDF